ncbi:MAG: sugar phosphate isomerase/epimerase [Synergistetes bacterium]|nr:sugar phosphate isomerase/epimerase [Synergistota bacterium]
MRLALNVSFSLSTFPAVLLEGSPEEVLPKAKSFGFDGLEIAVRSPEEVPVERINELCQKLKIKVVAIATGRVAYEDGLYLTVLEHEIRVAAIERLKRFIHLASNWGAGIVLGKICGTTSRWVNRRSALRMLKQAIDELLPYAERRKVILLIEPLNRYETDIFNRLDQALDFIKNWDSEYLKILPDTFHMNIEERNISEALKRAGEKIGYIHLGENNRLAPGMGHLPWEEIIETLREINYTGFLGLEILPIPSPEEAIKTTAERLRKLIDA